MKRTHLGLLLVLGLFSNLFPADAQADLFTNLQGYWQFNSNGTDSSGMGRDLDIVGGAGYGTGLIGEALSLPGSTSQFAQQAFNDTAFDVGGGDFTIQVWVDFQSLAGEQTLFEKFDGGAGPGYSLTKLSDNRILFFGDGYTTLASSATSLDTTNWHQVIMRRSGDDLDIFLNNMSIASNTVAGSVTPSTNPLLIGERDGAQDFPFNGLLDEVAFWNRGLSDLEIEQLYNNRNGFAITSVPEPSAISFLTVLGIFAAGHRRKRA
jgi:hypothetical protein